MDVPPPARPVSAVGADVRGTSPPPSSPPGDDVSRRLAALETAVADLAGRVDALAASADETVSAAVSREVQGVAAELRHTVSELGRLLVRDLGKLSKILAEHRDAIVAEVRGSGPLESAPAAGPQASTATEDAPSGGQEPEPDAASAAAPAAPDGGAADGNELTTPDEDAERSWLRRRRNS